MNAEPNCHSTERTLPRPARRSVNVAAFLVLAATAVLVVGRREEEIHHQPSASQAILFEASTNEFEAWLKQIEKEKYRPIHLNVHTAGGQLRVNAIAQPNPHNVEWQTRFGLDLAAYRRDFKEMQKSSFPSNLSPYAEGDAPRFSLVWTKELPAAGWSVREVTLADVQTVLAELQRQGFRPTLLQGYTEGGATKFLVGSLGTTGPRLAHAWQRSLEELRTYLDNGRRLGYRPLSLSAYPCQGGTRFATVVMDNKADGVLWQMGYRLTLAELRRAHTRWTSDGYRLALVCGYEHEAQSRYLAGWMKEAPGAPLPQTGALVPKLAVFDEAMTRFMRERGIRAGSLAVMKDGKLVLAHGYGHLDRAGAKELPPDAPFRLASVSKPITAAAVLKLIRAGKLSRDAKVYDLLRPEPLPGHTLDPRWQEVTVGHLLDHKGGWDSRTSFDPMFRPLEIALAVSKPGPAGTADVLRFMAGQPMQFKPGARYAYSNFGYSVLGRVIEKVSGKSYLEYIQQEILEPAGAKGVYLGRTLPAGRDPREPFYDDRDTGANVMDPVNQDQVAAPDGSFYLEAMDSHGGLVASASDVARFLNAYKINGEPADGKLASGAAFGSLPGTFTMAHQRSDGVRIVALFNRRKDSSGRDYFAIQRLLDQAASSVQTWPGDVKR